jgi:thiol:disulfide interchange protein
VIPGGAPSAIATAPAPSAATWFGTLSPKKDAPPIAWVTSEPEARDRARRAGLPLIVWARADWDTATLILERTVWTDPRVRDAARPFVALRLDLSTAEGDAERYAERYQVVGVPEAILFDAHGRRVTVLGGGFDAAQLVEALSRAGGE